MYKTFKEIDVTLTKPDTPYLLELCDGKGNTKYQITHYEYYDDWVEGPDHWLNMSYDYRVKRIYSLDTHNLEEFNHEN